MKMNHELVKKDAGLVFNIQQFSVHDGPGIRTIVFLKGCPLRCQWCANPESQHHFPELAYNHNKCIGAHECQICKQFCTAGAIKEGENDKVKIDRSQCTNCGECAEICPSKALEVFGKYMSVEEVLKIVEEDSIFYARSGGGLTLSGGEPLLQAEFVYKLLKEAKERGMDTAIETCGYVDWKKAEPVFKYLNTVFFDIKCVDGNKHKQFTGLSNEIILSNFIKLCQLYPKTPIIVRTPVVPGFNDTEEDIFAIANFIKGIPHVTYELLPYHRFGESKYTYLGKQYLLTGVEKPAEERMKALRSIVSSVLGND